MMVERWFMEEYLKMHRDAWDHRLQMQGLAHHQGSRSLTDTNKHGYVNSFIYCDTQFYLISNDRVVFLAVGVT